jgi:AAA ATPase domain
MTAALIGRAHPADLLRAEISRAVGSHGGLVLITGEAGIGKTTLVTRAAEEARRLGALVLGGACWDSGSAPGYWPWVQVIRGLRRSATGEEWAAAEAAAGGMLGVLLGEPSAASPRQETDGFQLYDAVTSALVTVSQARPVVVVLDDLHWADPASLRLLEFAAQHTWFERLLLVGAYRDVEVESAGHPLRPLMTPLVTRASMVTLTGLARDEVGALMARTAGREPAPELVDEVHRRTGGNPFFVEQTARLWHSGGSLTAIAPGVRDAVRRRLSLLAEPVVRLLTAAAVLGREFRRPVLAATVAAPAAEVDRLLDEAVTARLVTVLGAGRFAFAHDLVRETLYDSLAEAEARRWHAAVVRATDHPPEATDHPTEPAGGPSGAVSPAAVSPAARILPADLAGHAYLAGDELDPDRAVDLLIAAARDAGSRLAGEEAIGHRRRALERAGRDQPRRAVLIMLDLGGDLDHLGETEPARRLFEEAVALARASGDAGLLAHVALSVERSGGLDQLLPEAYGRLIGGPVPESTEDVAHELTVRVAELARAARDDETLGFSLWARHNAIWGLGTAAERAALTEELIAVSRRTGDRGSEYFAASFRWVALLELGDPGYLDQYRAFVDVAEREGRPRGSFASSVDTSLISTLNGRFAEAGTLLDRVAEEFADRPHPHFTTIAHQMRWSLLLMQGRYDELDGLHRLMRDTGHPCPAPLEGIVAVQRGDTAGALRLLDEVQGAAGGRRPGRAYAPLALRFQAQVAAASRDPELIERAREALLPYAGQWVVSAYGTDVSGPFDLWLGLLDAAQERWDDAIARFTAAHRSADLLQSPPWSIEARTQLARAMLGGAMLARPGLAGGRAAEGTALLAQARREAAGIGMRHLAAAPVESVPAGTGAGDGTGASNVVRQGNTFRRDGLVWVLGFAGRQVHLPDAKGLGDLHRLLSQPGVDIPAVRLVDPVGGAVVVAARGMGGDPVLDDEAKSRYKRRLSQLDEEIDRAVARGDDRRAAAADTERQALLDELRLAAGLAGRTRRLGDEAERARKTVTARIRDMLRRLDRGHPELAAHLRDAVSTGVTCRYQPAEPTPWHL